MSNVVKIFLGHKQGNSDYTYPRLLKSYFPDLTAKTLGGRVARTAEWRNRTYDHNSMFSNVSEEKDLFRKRMIREVNNADYYNAVCDKSAYDYLAD